MSRRGVSGGASIARHSQHGLTAVEIRRPELREFHVTCAPQDTLGSNGSAQAQEAYAPLASWLCDQGAVGVQERVFGHLRQRDAILAGRHTSLSRYPGLLPCPTAFIEGAPCGRQGLAGIHLYAVAGPACQPLHYRGRLWGMTFEHRAARHVHLSGLHGPTASATRQEQAGAMFALAGELLESVGCSYDDVIRTWIYIADILDWYDEFNAVRSAVYTQFGLMGQGIADRLPASTGIEGQPPHGLQCSMDLFALGGPGRARLSVEPLHNPLQNEAYSYGSAFARGMAIAFEGTETVYVSGTAAIDEAGRSVHEGHLAGQVKRTVDNVSALLRTRQMTLADIGAATVFVKYGQDAEHVRELLADWGGRVAEGIVVAADICRPELLFEIDALAVRTLD